MTTVNPGVMPFAFNSAVSFATSARTAFAIATPSMSTAPPDVCSSGLWPVASGLASARKIHRPRFSDDNHLDLTRILQLGLDTPRNFVRQRRHARVVDVFRRHEIGRASCRERV